VAVNQLEIKGLIFIFPVFSIFLLGFGPKFFI